MKKAALHNLGCKVNAYETEAMQQILEKGGYEIVSFHEKADIYVINTCSVTNVADRKSRQMIHQARKRNPQAIVIAAGCYVQTAGDKIKEDSAVDIIIGNNKKHELLSKIEEFELTHQRKDEIGNINYRQPYEELKLEKTAEHTRAFIKVQDGCNQFCTYCIIPFARGRVRSRKADDVVEEVKKLAACGYKEIVLTGIHLSSYGIDQPQEGNLLTLIQSVNEVEGIDRIRLGSLEPRIVTETFAKTVSSMKKICPHFHLSLQSGCDETLRRMNRQYDTREFEIGCEMLRKYFKHPAITTDVIVGFPGETQEEFHKTKKFLEKIHFYEMHIFKYSVRKGTKAEKMPNQIPETVKTQRSTELLALEKRMSEEYRSFYIGKEVEVLLEENIELNGKIYETGFTKEYIKVAKEVKNIGEKDLEKRKKSCANQYLTGKIIGKITDMILLME